VPERAPGSKRKVRGFKENSIASRAKVRYHAKTNDMEPPGLNKEQWLEKLTLIDQSLLRQGGSAQLTMVGSAAGIFSGQPGRTSIDLDVWKPGSRYQFQTQAGL
jgi:hypothetical protein